MSFWKILIWNIIFAVSSLLILILFASYYSPEKTIRDFDDFPQNRYGVNR